MPKNSVKLLFYCKREKPYLIEDVIKKGNYELMKYALPFEKDLTLNGKIVAEAECELVEGINCCCVKYARDNQFGYSNFLDNGVYKVDWKKGINLVDKNEQNNNPEIYKDDGVVFERKDSYIDTMLKNEDFKKMCRTPQELLDYITLGNEAFAIYLKNVKSNPIKFARHTLDNDSLFYTQKKIKKVTYIGALIKSSQNMRYIYDKLGKLYVFIPVNSKELCQILNGEQTILIRKNILKVFKKLMVK